MGYDGMGWAALGVAYSVFEPHNGKHGVGG